MSWQPAAGSAIATSYHSGSSSTVIPQLVASTVLVTARLARLKAEVVNVLYMLPEKPMRWVDPAAVLAEVGDSFPRYFCL